MFVIESGSRNALSVGRDPDHGTVAITRGLLDALDREELQGVIAHELSHIANLDSRHAVLVALLVGAIVLLTDAFLGLILEIAKHPWTGDDLKATVGALAAWLAVVVIGLIVGGLLKLVAPLAALAVQAAVSRDREYLADATAIGITRNTAGSIRALEKLESGHDVTGSLGGNRGTQHLWIVNPVRDPKPGGRGWFATHPATTDRIARLRALTRAGRAARRRVPRRSPGSSPPAEPRAILGPWTSTCRPSTSCSAAPSVTSWRARSRRSSTSTSASAASRSTPSAGWARWAGWASPSPRSGAAPGWTPWPMRSPSRRSGGSGARSG